MPKPPAGVAAYQYMDHHHADHCRGYQFGSFAAGSRKRSPRGSAESVDDQTGNTVKPDDDHACIPLYDADGNLTAVVHGDPGMSDAARAGVRSIGARSARSA